MKKLFEPAEAYVFQTRRQRRANCHAGVLVECGSQPVGADSGGRTTADHEVEEPRSGGAGRFIISSRDRFGKGGEGTDAILR